VRVQHDWGVGVKGKDESAVIALSVEDRKVFIATGYGSEAYLPDGKVGAIRDHARPALKANDFSTGLYLIDAEVARAAADAHHVELSDMPPPMQSPQRGVGCGGSALAVFVLIVIGLSLFGRRRGGGGGFGGGWGSGLFTWLALDSLFRAGRGGGWGDSGWGGGGFGGGGGWGGGGGFGGFGGGSGGGGGAGGDF